MPTARSLAVLMPLLLAGCGFGNFVDDTHSSTLHVNRPIANSEVGRTSEGRDVDIKPLVSEAGNVWPGPVVPEPTLEDLQKEPPKPLPDLAGSTAPSLSNVPALAIPTIPHHLQPRPGEDGSALTGPLPGAPVPGSVASPQGTITHTPKGNAVSTRNPNGLGETPARTPATANNGITVPNGDGTSTVIAPDGTITTIPTPK